MTAVLTAAACIGTLLLIAFALGYYLGRFGERGKIADYLWDVRGDVTAGRAIELGLHRKRAK